jgi:hypothetical protein
MEGIDMFRRKHSVAKRPLAAGVMAALVVSALLSPSRAYALAEGEVATSQIGHVDLQRLGGLFGDPQPGKQARVWFEALQAWEPTSVQSDKIRWPLAKLDDGVGLGSNRRPLPAIQASSSGRQRSAGRKTLGAAIGAVGGFFGGGYLGAVIEGDRCHCDDPGLMGFIIGAPVGAVIGGILGFKLF